VIAIETKRNTLNLSRVVAIRFYVLQREFTVVRRLGSQIGIVLRNL